MLFRIKTGWNVQQVDQNSIVYLVTSAQQIADAGIKYVFTDRHTLVAVAAFRDTLDDLKIVDFRIAYATQWSTTPDHPDRQEKKQAEFLVYQAMPWSLVNKIGVLNSATHKRVAEIFTASGTAANPEIVVQPTWYYD